MASRSPQEGNVIVSCAAYLMLAVSLTGASPSETEPEAFIGIAKTGSDGIHWFSGRSGSVDVHGVTVTYEVEGGLAPQTASGVARSTLKWSVDKRIDGYEICARLPLEPTGWRCTLYPFVGNETDVKISRLMSVGVPAALLFREDLSRVMLFGVDPSFDYMNPTTWTGTMGFRFHEHSAPHFRICGGIIKPGVSYSLPLQVFTSDAGNSVDAITQLVTTWIAENHYKVEPMSVRTPDDALALFLKGRRTTNMWHPGMGYQIEDVWPAVYLPTSAMSAWFEYLLYCQTGDALWRQRSFEAMDFLLKAQNNDAASPLYGYMHTAYLVDKKEFNSDDRGTNPGYKIDMDFMIAHYMLKTWAKVLENEKIDKTEWHDAAVRCANWAVAQQSPDGGFPQKLDYDTLKKSISVVSGRALSFLPSIAAITKDEKFTVALDKLEQFLRTNVEGRFWFCGQHPDLYPGDFESDSVWNAVEYWLDKYGRTHDADCLKRAQADAYFAFLMFCPKQLSWIKNPTQTCHTEQMHYQQYSNYAYHNKKLACMYRLGKETGNGLFTDLFNRAMQCGFWAQVTEGEYTGAQHERMSDPWLNVSKEYDSKGTRYMNELSLDANLQLLEAGIAHAPGAKSAQ